jgi:hypothetical protein
LHQARSVAAAKALVEAGAPRTWRDADGLTAEQALRASGAIAVADYLRSL